jgi:hypothetical protein
MAVGSATRHVSWASAPPRSCTSGNKRAGAHLRPPARLQRVIPERRGRPQPAGRRRRRRCHVERGGQEAGAAGALAGPRSLDRHGLGVGLGPAPGRGLSAVDNAAGAVGDPAISPGCWGDVGAPAGASSPPPGQPEHAAKRTDAAAVAHAHAAWSAQDHGLVPIHPAARPRPRTVGQARCIRAVRLNL